MTTEHAKQMRQLRAEKNKLEQERDHWMNEAIDLRQQLEAVNSDAYSRGYRAGIEAAAQAVEQEAAYYRDLAMRQYKKQIVFHGHNEWAARKLYEAAMTIRAITEKCTSK